MLVYDALAGDSNVCESGRERERRRVVAGMRCEKIEEERKRES